MPDNTPDLVQRAAARLQHSSSAKGASDSFGASSRAEKADRAPLFARFEAIGQRNTIPQSSSARPVDRQPQVTISPTSLAANGICVPASGLSRTVEEFRSLKRQILSKSRRSGDGIEALPNRMILVTSARTGEGKTFTAINLALALAYEKETQVLLIDADAYRQNLLKFLGITADRGWLDVVSGETGRLEETILRTNITGLSVLPAGKVRPEIPEIMSSRRMKNMLDELARDNPAQFAVMDALPCLTSTEPAILAGLAAQVLFVVAAHQTSREDVESSLRLLNTSPSVNLVLNKAEPLLSEQFKGYGYGYAHQP